MKNLLASRSFQVAVLLALSIFLAWSSLVDMRWRQQIRNFTFDTYNIMKPREPSGNIVIADIDDATLARPEFGQWPWPRDRLAGLVDKLKLLGAKVIVFDMVFPEEDRMAADNDAIFSESMKRAGNVVTGFAFSGVPSDSTPRSAAIYRSGLKGIKESDFITRVQGATVNIPILSKYAAGNGSFFTSADIDGIIRRVPMLVAHENRQGVSTVYPSLSLETLRVLLGERGGKILFEDQQYRDLDPARFGVTGIHFRAADMMIPLGASGEFTLYYAKSRPEWYVPVHRLFAADFDPALVKDKVVLIGTSAVGLKDIRSTPLDVYLPGVELHLNIIDQILQGHYLTRPFWVEGMEAFSILALSLSIIAFATFVGVVMQAAILLLASAGALYGGWYAFTEYGLQVDVAYLVFSILVVFIISTILTYIRLERERSQIRSAFGLYISPDFMKELTRHPEKLRLGGESRELTIMFTDIRKFTSISEGLSPQELIALMNDFLTPMSDRVMQNRGTIDKYMGDAMMAFWNAPLDDLHHARNACIAALGMQSSLEPINQKIKERAVREGREPILLNAGIGINTGPCAVGNMGSRQRFAYSVLGDAVNLASRLEGQTKTYGVGILIGEETARQVKDFAVLELDLLKVQGRTQPVRVSTVLGDSTMAAGKEFGEWRDLHNAMLENYRARNFDQAFQMAAKARKLYGAQLGEFYDLYQQRAAKFMQYPPPSDWDGVYVATSK